MENIPVEFSGFYYALGYLEGIIDADTYNEILKANDSARLSYLLISLKNLHDRMIDIKKSAGEQNRLTKGDQDG